MSTNLASLPDISRFSLHVKITVAPENAEKFLVALRPAYLAVIAEPECSSFEVFQNPDNPGEIRFVENWDASPKWMMEVQAKKEYYVPYNAATEPMYVKPREIEIWSRMEGDQWRSVKM